MADEEGACGDGRDANGGEQGRLRVEASRICKWKIQQRGKDREFRGRVERVWSREAAGRMHVVVRTGRAGSFRFAFGRGAGPEPELASAYPGRQKQQQSQQQV